MDYYFTNNVLNNFKVSMDSVIPAYFVCHLTNIDILIYCVVGILNKKVWKKVP